MHHTARLSVLLFLGVAFTVPTVALLLPTKKLIASRTRRSDRRSIMALRGRSVADVETKGERDESASNTVSGATNASPTHLVVLVHGLHGTPEDLSYLKEALERSGGTGTLVHLARCNKNRTLDGVAEGGTRLAQEVLQVVASTPSLRSISLVGNSLGGLYARYAAKLLYREADGTESNPDDRNGVGDAGSDTSTGVMTTDFTQVLEVGGRRRAFSTNDVGAARLGERDILRLTDTVSNRPTTSRDVGGVLEPENGNVGDVSGTVAGLRPAVFVTIAAPHLGVRRFTYIPVPSPLHGLASVFVGKTGSDLFLGRMRNEPSQVDRTISPARMIAAAASVTASVTETLVGRRTDSFVAGGVMNMATTRERGRTGANGREEEESPLLYRMATSEEFLKPLKAFQTRRAYANRRGDFMVPYETAAFVEPNEGDGAEGTPEESRVRGIADQVLGSKQGTIVGTSSVPAVSRSASTGYILEAMFGSEERKERESMEDEMAAGLNSCGWQKVSVDFGGLLPFSHNKICALSRTRVATALWSAGRNIMDHAAEFVVGRCRDESIDIELANDERRR